MPTLSGEDVERERRVDLRIRQGPQSQSQSSSDSTRALRAPTPPADTLSPDLDEDHEGTSIEVVNDPSSPPEVITEPAPQAQPSPRNASPAVSATRQAYSFLRTASSRLSSRGSLGASRRNVDPVIGPSFSTRVLDESDLDTESLAPTLDGDESSWCPARPQPSSLLTRENSSSGGRDPQSSAPIPEIRFPVADLAAADSFHQWDSGQSIPPGQLNGKRNDKDSTTQTRLEKSESTTTSPRTVPTVPVDLDDCSFLEAEKNLQAIHDMATEHLQQGEYDEALEVFEEILRGQLTRYGTDHYRVATALHNMGVVHMRRGDYTRAAHAYREAIAIRRRALSPDHPDVAASLAQLGVAYLERRQHKKAIAAFRQSLKIRRKCLGSTHPKVAKILNNIGCALYELNALDVAQVAFEEALDIQRMNLSQEPAQNQAKSNFLLLSLASTLCNIASIKLYFGRIDEASVDFQEALLVQQCVFGDDHPIPRQTEESLRWIESSRDRYQQQNDHADPHDGDTSSHGNVGILSRLFRRSGGPGAGGDASGLGGPAEFSRFDSSSQAPGPSSRSGLLACTVRDDARDVLGTVEDRLKRLQDKIELACGPPARAAYDYDDEEEDEEDSDSEFDVVDEDFENGLSGKRRVYEA
jgi:Tfp pilus assembly protein PilF